MRRLLLMTTGMIAVASGAQAVTSASPLADADALATEILGAGITILSSSLVGEDGQAGTFAGGMGSIGIDEGIILSTGSVSDAVGSNVLDGTTTEFSTPGFTDLDDLVAPNRTFDGVRLDIEFKTDSGDISFDYVFASEEYNEFVFDDFNDVFALFLDGENIALVPGTTDFVSIDTVNGGNPFGDSAVNEEFFNNNDLDDGGPFFAVEYDGFTDVFTASATGLSAGTHSLSFAIADTGDSFLDSAVFVKAGSFSSGPPPIDPIPLPAAAWLLLGGVGALGALRRRKTKS